MASDYSKALTSVRNGFREGVLDSLSARQNAIKALREMLVKEEDALVEAIRKDLCRPKQEALMTELWPIKMEINIMLKNLASWIADEYVSKSFISMMDTAYIQRQPYGVVLIFGSWNFPIAMLATPMIGAIAAGNTVILKPSEYAPNCSALVAELIPKYFDQRICQVVQGDAEFSQNLLTDERFDYIFFTGGYAAGRAVYTAAAKHVTPVTLELGGKCPTYVDSNVNLPMAVKRIMFSKVFNAGQVCLATDYVLCHTSVLTQFHEMVCKVLDEFFGEDPEKSPHFGRIINRKHFERLTGLLTNTKGKVLRGSKYNERELYIAPTVVVNVSKDDVLMQEEIFGPILPVLEVKSAAEAVHFINSKNKPLAIYVFTNDDNVFANFKHGTSSGAIVQNDCTTHALISQLPFGGVGSSGFGNYHGRFSLETFSHKRSVVQKSRIEFVNEKFLYPPYNDNKTSWANWFLSNSDRSSCALM